MSREPESLEDQAAQEGFVPEYQPDEEPADDFPHHPAETDDEAAYYDSISRDARGDYDTSDPYDKEYDVP